MNIPFHLFLPLAASFLLVCGLLLVKRASTQGVGPWTVTLFANYWAAFLFSFLWFLGGDGQPMTMLWQPAIIAGLYVLGQIFMFSAIDRGDVSVATPVFGVKVVFVALLLATVFGLPLPNVVWYAAGLAAMGIGLVQWSPRDGKTTELEDDPPVPRANRGKLLLTILLAVGSAFSFACFDVLVQHWAPAWGAGRFLPPVYWIVAILSLGFVPFADLSVVRQPNVRTGFLLGTMLIAVQAICIVSTLAVFGDAARVNVVYALRGMWGVGLAWAVAVKWGGSEASLPRSVLLARLIGAALLTGAVIMVVLLGTS